MPLSKKLNVYFPINNLNPQGWISEFITPVINKSGGNADVLSNLFYNNFLESGQYAGKEQLLKTLKDSSLNYDNFIQKRTDVGAKQEEKMIFLNGNYLDLFEVNEKYKGQPVEEESSRRYIQFITTAKPYLLAFLQPYIRLSYGYRKNKKEAFSWVDFPFTQYYNLDYILQDKQHGRAEHSGIESIDVTNKFNLGTQVNSQINIQFTFGSMKILTQEILENGTPLRGQASPFPYGFSFIKLLANLDTNLEVIRLEYGRKVADGFEQTAPVEFANLRSVIEAKEKKVYLLNKFQHGFSFDNKGVVSINVNYYNFHDTAKYSANNVSIPASTPENNFLYKNIDFETSELLTNYKSVKETVDSLEAKLQESKKVSDTKEISKLESEQKDQTIRDITKKLARANKTLNLTKRSLRRVFVTAFLDKIKDNGQLFSVNFNSSRKAVQDTAKNSETFSFIHVVDTTINLVEPISGEFVPIIQSFSEYDINKFLKSPKLINYFKKTGNDSYVLLDQIFNRIFNVPYEFSNKSSKYGHIMFFPLKALFAAAYSFLSKDDKVDEKEQIPHMLFGNVLLKVGDSICSINIGDLLIETGVFQKWYYEKVTKKDRLEYSFGAFIFDVITDLVPEALYRNRVGFDDKAPTTAIKENQFYLKRNLTNNDLQLKLDLYLKSDEENLQKFGDILTKIPTNKPMPLIYYGQLNNKTMQIGSPIFSKYGDTVFDFNEINDSGKGIMHIKIGSDGGMVESVSFNHQDFKKIRTALSMESLADKSSRYFFFYYQLGIDMLGNNSFSYDSMVCVPSNPLGIDSSVNDPGIAGYYKVKETRDSINSSNDYRTYAVADWAFNPRDQNRETSKIDQPPVERINIKDALPIEVNDPINYVIELVENDAVSILNQQLQKMNRAEKKANEQTKKDNNKPPQLSKKLDTDEISPSKKGKNPKAKG